MAPIGLISDTHGRHLLTRQAVRILLAAGAGELIHLGDVGTCAVLEELLVATPGPDSDGDSQRLQTLPVHLVFGNADGDISNLARYARELGLDVQHPAGRLTLEDGRSLAFTHGHDRRLLAAALEEHVAYLCHGHTHRAADTHQGPTRIINPGALCRAARYSVALLDTAQDRLTFLEVPHGD